MVINVVSPHIVPVLLLPIQRCCARRSARAQVTQTAMNRALLPPHFSLATRYAAVANTIYVVLFYNSGMPFLVPLALLTFYLMYCFDKITFLRGSQTPPKFDISLAQLTV